MALYFNLLFNLSFSNIINQVEICTAPAERYDHVAAMYESDLRGQVMYVYGGYSQNCADYCSDVWAFLFSTKTWMELPIQPEWRLEPIENGVPTG